MLLCISLQCRHMSVSLILTFIFSQDWSVSLRSITSTTSGFRCLKSRSVHSLVAVCTPDGCSNGEVQWGENAFNVRPRFRCHQLVLTTNASVRVSTLSYFAHRTVKCRAGGRVPCPRQHILSSHLLLLY